MLKFIAQLAESSYPTLAIDDYNARKLLEVSDFVEPCRECKKQNCPRETCKFVTIGEIGLFHGEVSARYVPDCRKIKYYPTFGMLVNTIVTVI